MRFALINSVPPGFCRKMHILAPGGRLEDLANLSRDDLPRAGLSPTHMEAIQGFAEWHKRGITPTLGLLMWYLESVQREDGSFLRTEDAKLPSIGVAVRYLQIAGQLGIHRGECESVDRGARWLEDRIGNDGLIRMPVTGLVDYGMLARTIRSLNMVSASERDIERIRPACKALVGAQLETGAWPTYPDGEPSTGATSLAVTAIAESEELFEVVVNTTWLFDAQNDDGGWGEYLGSPSRPDNTFWAIRACTAADVEGPEVVEVSYSAQASPELYGEVMTARTQCQVDVRAVGTDVQDRALESLTDDADRYAVTALLGLTLCELSLAQASDVVHEEALPIRTPEFIRREPPLYDQLAETAGWSWWTKMVERAAQIRLAEATIGWLAGLSTAIALVGEELVNGLASLPVLPLAVLLVIEVVVVAGWLGAQQRPGRRLQSVTHLAVSFVIALLLVLLIKNPDEIEISPLPTIVFALLLTMIVEAISVATDKADLLNRLSDD